MMLLFLVFSNIVVVVALLLFHKHLKKNTIKKALPWNVHRHMSVDVTNLAHLAKEAL